MERKESQSRKSYPSLLAALAAWLNRLGIPHPSQILNTNVLELPSALTQTPVPDGITDMVAEVKADPDKLPEPTITNKTIKKLISLIKADNENYPQAKNHYLNLIRNYLDKKLVLTPQTFEDLFVKDELRYLDERGLVLAFFLSEYGVDNLPDDLRLRLALDIFRNQFLNFEESENSTHQSNQDLLEYVYSEKWATNRDSNLRGFIDTLCEMTSYSNYFYDDDLLIQRFDFLVSKGFNLNSNKVRLSRIFNYCVKHKKYKFLFHLLDSGCNVNAQDFDGNSLLACLLETEKLELAKEILRYKPKIITEDKAKRKKLESKLNTLDQDLQERSGELERWKSILTDSTGDGIADVYSLISPNTVPATLEEVREKITHLKRTANYDKYKGLDIGEILSEEGSVAYDLASNLEIGVRTLEKYNLTYQDLVNPICKALIASKKGIPTFTHNGIEYRIEGKSTFIGSFTVTIKNNEGKELTIPGDTDYLIYEFGIFKIHPDIIIKFFNLNSLI